MNDRQTWSSNSYVSKKTFSTKSIKNKSLNENLATSWFIVAIKHKTIDSKNCALINYIKCWILAKILCENTRDLCKWNISNWTFRNVHCKKSCINVHFESIVIKWSKLIISITKTKNCVCSTSWNINIIR